MPFPSGGSAVPSEAVQSRRVADDGRVPRQQFGGKPRAVTNRRRLWQPSFIDCAPPLGFLNSPSLVHLAGKFLFTTCKMLPIARRVLATQVTGVVGRASAFNASALARQRLLSTLAILEQKDGQLNLSSLSAFTAAQKLGGTIHGFVAGSSIKGVAAEAAKVDGVEKIITVENGAYEKVL